MNKKVLVIDDEEINRTLLKMLIKRTSNEIEVYEAKTGQEAIDILKNQNFDIILIDVLLPDINGLEIIKHIKNKNTRIVIVSALSKEEIEKFSIPSEVLYIPKPIEIENFNKIFEE